MRDAFDEGMHYPSPSQKRELLEQITALPNCGHYQIKNIERWFQKQRGRYQLTNTANLTRPVIAADPESESETELYPTITDSAEEKLRILFSELFNPSHKVISTWAELLGASVEDVEAWVAAEREALENPSPISDDTSQEFLPQEEQKPPRWRPLQREAKEVTSTEALFIRIPGQGSKRRLVSIDISKKDVVFKVPAKSRENSTVSERTEATSHVSSPRVIGWPGDVTEVEDRSSPTDDITSSRVSPEFIDDAFPPVKEELEADISAHSTKSPTPSVFAELSGSPDLDRLMKEEPKLDTIPPSSSTNVFTSFSLMQHLLG
ncbi:hypothetical protein GYMLUDRAFT_454432 [Collybiopsis luxurians FD-317 M1]|uniref:Homeobox domain-containing protein n=1 Tax=Collybiopsis luxurians FD-317 M1 TaxID=944289 RepID=A0A0D0CVQ4_9AGAR|nr:hypothetical protein GYMLUDRAFT_454432 [Collybiopsis luxurians FD-317 M1]